MWPDWVRNPGPLTNKSGTLPTILRGPAICKDAQASLYLCSVNISERPYTDISWPQYLLFDHGHHYTTFCFYSCLTAAVDAYMFFTCLEKSTHCFRL